MTVRALSFLLVGTLAVAQPPAPRQRTQAPTQQAAPVSPGSIRGQVVSTAGEPLRKVEVILAGGNQRGGINSTTLTDATGVFVFSEVQPGTYNIVCRRSGFTRENERQRPVTVTVNSDQETSGVMAKLTPAAVVTGKIVDEDGDVFMGATVQIMRETWQRGRRTMAVATGVQTNDLGEFRASSLSPGRYYMNVSARGRTVQVQRDGQSTGQTGYTSMYYPGTLESSQAQPFTLAAGQEARMDLQLRRVSTFRVRGHVVDPNSSQGLRGVSVVAMDENSRSTNFARVGGDGRFELSGVPAGSYSLVAARMDNGRQRAALPLQIANRDVDNVILQLQPPVEAPVSIRLEGEQAVDTGSIRIGVEPERASPIDRPAAAERKPDGKITVWLPPTGRVRVGVGNLPDGTYVKSIRAGSIDITDMYFEGGAAGPVEILLGRGAGQVTGTVQTTDNKPYSNAFVLLAPDSSKREHYWNFRTALGDGSGAFSIKGLAPGEYTVFAFNDTLESTWQDPEFLKQYESKGTKVKIGENGSEAVQPKVIE